MKLSSENTKFVEKLFENISVDIVVANKGKVINGWKETNLIREYSKLYLVLSGNGSISIEDKHYNPKRGQLLLIPEGVKHSFSTDPQNPYVKCYCHFNARVGSMSIFDVIDCDYLINISESDVELLRDIMDSMIVSQNDGSITGSLFMKSHCLKLIGYFFEHVLIRGTKLESQTLIAMKETAIYIEEHIGTDITVDKLAMRCHLHPNYFSQVFKNTYGVPPVKYINNSRMERAKQLLVTSDYSIGRIAEVVGFLNVYYFSSTFKKYADMSPSNYRKLYFENIIN